MRYEPSYPELLLTRLTFRLFGKRIYGEYARRLPVRGGERALDFGCGMGTVAYFTAKRLPRGHLACADVSERWLAACRKTLRRRGNVSFHFLGAGAPPLPENSFDLIYCHFVLHDIPGAELERLIPLLAAALKPGGLLAFREPLAETARLNVIQRLMRQSGLTKRDSRVTDVPLMGNALESVYGK